MDFDFINTINDEMAVNWVFDPAKKAFFDTETDARLPFTFDPDTGIFRTSKGIELHISSVSKFILADRMEQLQRDMPMPPERRVKVAENEYTTEPDTNDFKWKMEYNQFMTKANLDLFKFYVIMSIEVVIPNDSEKRITKLAKKLGIDVNSEDWEDERLYLYVQDSVGGDDRELSAFMEILKGRNLITQEAIKRSEARFQDAGSGNEPDDISTTVKG